MPRFDAGGRHALARVLLGVSVLAAAWSALLAGGGGLDGDVFGLTIRSHNPRRPLLAAVLVFALFVWARGVREVRDVVVSFVRHSDRWLARRRLPHASAAIVLSAAFLMFGLTWGTGVAGGSDSYGYISQSELWLRGLPIVRQPWTAAVPWPDADWTFSPLGYRPGREPGTIVPGYAVGLPLLMAAARSVAGPPAVFWLAPLAGAALVLVTYAVGRDLDSRAAGLVAAWLVATNATLVAEVTAPMSDVIAAAGLAGSFWLLMRSPDRLPVAAGLTAGVAAFVRPNLAPTLAVMALWVAARPPAGVGSPRLRQLLHAFVFLAAASPGLLIAAWANWRLFGSPLISGYGDFETIYDWTHVVPNLQRYPALVLQSRALPALIGLAALLIPARRVWPRVADRAVLAGIALFMFSIAAQYVAYEPATGEGYLRFLLPCAPFVMTGAARVLLLVARPGWTAALVAAVLLAQGAASLHWACRDGKCFNRSEQKYPGAGAIVRSRTEPDCVIYAFQHSGSLRYYGGRMTLRFDLLDRQWLDRSIDWFAERGVHPYAVLDDWEVAIFRERFAGQRRVSQIADPVVTYRGDVVTHFYDLFDDPARRGDAEEWVDRFDGPWYPRPAAPPAFALPGTGTGK